MVLIQKITLYHSGSRQTILRRACSALDEVIPVRMHMVIEKLPPLLTSTLCARDRDHAGVMKGLRRIYLQQVGPRLLALLLTTCGKHNKEDRLVAARILDPNRIGV